MARSNSFTLRGFVGKDAELKITSTGKQLAQFSLCVEERWQTVDGPMVSRKEWFRITAWGRQSEIAAAKIQKGTLVEVHGRLENRQWQDAHGTTHYTIDLIARELVFIDKATGQPVETTSVADEAETAAVEPAEAEPVLPHQQSPGVHGSASNLQSRSQQR